MNRIVSIAAEFETGATVSRFTSPAQAIWHANPLTVRFALFRRGQSIFPAESEFSFVRLELYLEREDPDLITAAKTSAAGACSQADWRNGLDAHATFDFTATDLNFDPVADGVRVPDIWAVFVGVPLTDIGQGETTLAAGFLPLEYADNPGGSPALDPPAPWPTPASYASLVEQVDDALDLINAIALDPHVRVKTGTNPGADGLLVLERVPAGGTGTAADDEFLVPYVNPIAVAAKPDKSLLLFSHQTSGGQQWVGNFLDAGAVGSRHKAIVVNAANTPELRDNISTVKPFFFAHDPRYGAVGDGVADDRAAIQAALDAASAAGGGIVALEARTYRITAGTLASSGVSPGGCAGILIPSGCGLMGAGAATVLRGDTAAGGAGCLIANKDHNTATADYGAAGRITLRDLTLENDGTGTAHMTILLGFGHGDGLTCENVSFGTSAGEAVHVNRSRNVRLRRCRFTATHLASPTVTLADGTMGAVSTSPATKTVDNVRIEDCDFSANAVTATAQVELGRTATVILTNITVDGSRIALPVPTVNAAGIGLNFATTPDSLKNVRITNNVFTGGGHIFAYPIYFANGSSEIEGLAVSGNHFDGAKYKAAVVAGGADDLAVTNHATRRGVVVSCNRFAPAMANAGAVSTSGCQDIWLCACDDVTVRDNLHEWPADYTNTTITSECVPVRVSQCKRAVIDANTVRFSHTDGAANAQAADFPAAFRIGLTKLEAGSIKAHMAFTNNRVVAVNSAIQSPWKERTDDAYGAWGAGWPHVLGITAGNTFAGTMAGASAYNALWLHDFRADAQLTGLVTVPLPRTGGVWDGPDGTNGMYFHDGRTLDTLGNLPRFNINRWLGIAYATHAANNLPSHATECVRLEGTGQ